MDPQSLKCTHCQAVTTNDGKTVWVCENCGMENQPVAAAAPAAAPADVSAAQAAVDSAAASMAAPASGVPATPATPAPDENPAQ